jgi:tetratricopeptide (TPR) repeat protein
VADSESKLAKVEFRRGELTLPTYRLLGENRNPVFHSQYGVAHIYPYTLQDEIASTPTETRYRTLELENRYLRLTVLPELGGRVYSLFDKIAGQEVFYKNSVIRFSPLAIRGAFFSGGLEFSFPVAHAPTTASPVNWAMTQQADGSASIHIGGIEHMSGLRWTVSLSLFPDRCAVAQDVHLSNPTPLPGRYHYWTNASLASDDRTEFIYPLRRVRSYEFAGTASWPIARLDLIADQPGLPGMEGVPMWPAGRMHAPVSFRWEKDMLAQVSIFGREVAADFFGAWQHSHNVGYAHFADSADVAGMKLWSWGRSEVGIVNQTALTDDGSLYAETQCGAMETQLDFEFMPPGGRRAWREWWLPLRGLGGLSCATSEAGARLVVTPGGDDRMDLLVGLCPVRPMQDLHLTVGLPGKTLIDERISCAPEKPWSKTTSIDPRWLADHPLSLRIADPAGGIVMEFVHDRQAGPVELSPASHEPAPTGPEDDFRQGLEHEKMDNRPQALEAYRRALSIDGNHAPANLRLGLMMLRAADFDSARRHLEEAARGGALEAEYYLGVLCRYLGDARTAAGHFSVLSPDNSLWSAAQRGLAGIALLEGRWQDAAALLRSGGAGESQTSQSSLLRAIALRRAGETAAASEALQTVLLADPLSLPALREASLLDPAAGNPRRELLERLLTDDRQYSLDLACFYLDHGLYQDALALLTEVAGDWSHPMCAYLAAFVASAVGDPDLSRRWREAANQADPDLVFPSRLWEIVALLYHLQLPSPHARANYYLGNFYFAHHRYDDAARLWEEARDQLGDSDVLLRNLGLHAWNVKHDPALAIGLVQQALQLNPRNQDLYLILDNIYREQDLGAERRELLAAMRRLDPPREDVRKRMLSMMVDLEMHEEVLRILTTEEFGPLEMDQSFHQVYVRALSLRAEAHLKAERLEQAAQDYRQALDYPKSHGVGRPTTGNDAEILYRLACVYEKLGRFQEAISAWRLAGQEHHVFGEGLHPFVQFALDKLGRYSELGFEV